MNRNLTGAPAQIENALPAIQERLTNNHETDPADAWKSLGFPSEQAANQHADWLGRNGSSEYKTWLASYLK